MRLPSRALPASLLLSLLLTGSVGASQQVVSEFGASNSAVIQDQDGEYSDWVELHNAGALAVDLGGWYLTDSASNKTKWQIPTPTVLAPGAFLIVFASDKNRQVAGQELHTNFKLSAGGEYLGLVMADGVTVASEFAPTFPEQFNDVSYGNVFDPLLTATRAYFPVPTPGAPNGTGGPFVKTVTPSVSQPDDADDLVITAEVVPVSGQTITAVDLQVRVMFGSRTSQPMRDDGIAPDPVAGDGLWSALIPASRTGPGNMLRWYVTAGDAAGGSGRAPFFANPTNSAEYFGVMIADPAVVSPLRVVYWFVENPGQANTSNGTRCSLWFEGEFMDNLLVRPRGSSSLSFPKKSYKFDFNPGGHILWEPELERMEEINLNSTWSDKAYVRQLMSWELYARAGAIGSSSEMIRLQQNGSFFSVAAFVEQVDEIFLDRRGLDEDGALYKMYNELTDAYNGVEKKTRQTEDNSDLGALVAGCQLTGAALEDYLFDNLDLPAVVNYLAATSLIHDNDHVGKNYYLYRDTEGDQEWRVLPWDKDLTWGRNFTRRGGVLNDTIWAAQDPQSHPLFGDVSHQKIDQLYNRLIDACYRVPRIQQMYLRRLRTLMDEILQDPAVVPADERLLERRFMELYADLHADVAADAGRWGIPSWGAPLDFIAALDQIGAVYLPVRRAHLFTTHTASGLIPGRQVDDLWLDFGASESDPASGLQAEEWIELRNLGAAAVDLSGWTVEGGISFDIPGGTVLAAGSSLYLSPDLRAFRNRGSSPTGGERLLVQGPYEGDLSAGEAVLLYDRERRLAGAFGTGFVLFAEPATAGMQSWLNVAGATPGGLVRLAASTHGGGPTQSPWGMAALTPPVSHFPPRTADANGSAGWHWRVPAALSGRQLWLQALDRTAGQLSTGASLVVQ